MYQKCVLGLAVLCCAAAPASAGGGGPVSILRLRGSVLIREIDFKTGKPIGAWKPAKTKGLIGTYLLRTGRRSWAHLDLPFRIRERGQWKYVPAACVDSRSVVRIDSYADSEVRLVRGRISKADGKRVGRLPSVMGVL
jgi:hypothetical protein